MQKTSFHILRVGLAITFLWVGILIIKEPEAWGGYIQSWAMNLLPIPLTEAMIGTAILDILIGFFLLVDTYTWFAALVGALHIVIVLTVAGITDITVRDLAILSGCLAVAFDSWKTKNLDLP